MLFTGKKRLAQSKKVSELRTEIEVSDEVLLTLLFRALEYFLKLKYDSIKLQLPYI